MPNRKTLVPAGFLGSSAVLLCMLAVLGYTCAAQTTKPAPNPEQQWQEMAKHPELMNELATLMNRLQHEVQLPAERRQSHLLPLLPTSTVFYAALPNYGDAARQALDVFHQELAKSAALRQWWTQGEMTTTGPQMEQAIRDFERISDYLGDEIVIGGLAVHPTPKSVLIADIKKPGLKLALQQMLNQLPEKSRPGVRVLDPQELATAQGLPPGQDFVVLVRPDYVIGAGDLDTLRTFNAYIDGANRGFAATPFGQRIVRAYQDGVTSITAVNLRAALDRFAQGQQGMEFLQQSGFGDVQYLVWEHTKIAGQQLSESELSFSGPRRGMAAWLGAPTQLGSLGFVSPKAVLALSMVLANPPQMYADIRALATASNPRAFDAVLQMQQALHVDFAHDLFGTLGGEITFELDGVTPAEADWRAILRVNDPARLQQTLTTMLASGNIKPEPLDAGGHTYYRVRVPSGNTAKEIAYTFADGYMVIGSSAAQAEAAVRRHRTGESLDRSKTFLAAMPAGHPLGISGLLYENPLALFASQMQTQAPNMGESLQKAWQQTTPAVMTAYAEPTTIRGASTSAMMDTAVLMTVAAVALPNLLRSRVAANDAVAVSTLRIINVAQATYSTTHPDRGYARNLATLGTVPGGRADADHAGLIDSTLGCGSDWCVKSGFRFHISAVCLEGQCADYVAVATPVNPGTGSRSFCSTSSGVIRFKAGILNGPVSVVQCRAWAPLQ